MSVVLTVCDSSEGLVEGGCVAVVSECNTHSSGQEPSGQSEGLFVLQQPALEALVVHFITLKENQKQLDCQRYQSLCL